MKNLSTLLLNKSFSFFVLLLLLLIACKQVDSDKTATTELTSKEKINLRADSFDLGNSYSPPPGDPLSHHASGFAKILCSAVLLRV